jgi:hypothetical protein
MLTVHYFEESHWLAAAVEFPGLCRSNVAREVLRRASTIAWLFGYPAVSHWLNTEVLTDPQPAAGASDPGDKTDAQGALLPLLPEGELA